ncbi:hypothetical protein [Thermoactinomyces mirandus]|uniref:hypothetical protein n=1 Tax=Thermoactinomyces mirandus TaxID=2756294 RepID=UPI001FE8EAD0|nr:hypothetical protein [Thermoactinomyces mirandus]
MSMNLKIILKIIDKLNPLIYSKSNNDTDNYFQQKGGDTYISFAEKKPVFTIFHFIGFFPDNDWMRQFTHLYGKQ